MAFNEAYAAVHFPMTNVVHTRIRLPTGIFIFGIFLVALSSVIATALLHTYSPLELSWIRFFITSAIAIPLLLARSRTPLPSSMPEVFALFSLGIATLAGFFLFVIALAGISVAKATALFFCYPFLVVLLGFRVLRESGSLVLWIQTGLGFLGVWLMLGAGPDSPGWYELAALLSGTAVAVRLILTRRVAHFASSLQIVASESVVSATLLLAVVDLSDLPLLENASLLAFYIVTVNLSRVCVIYALRACRASRLAPLAFFEILFAVGLEGTLLNRWATVEQLAAIAVICTAGLLSTAISEKE
jgi:drug/metabolite transporter (DMT)-like permease